MNKLNKTKVLKRIGKNLKAIRQKQRLTQTGLARIAKLNTRQIRRIENGEHEVGIYQILVLSESLNVPLDVIVAS